MKAATRLWPRLLLLGAASFWTPDVIVHGITRGSFSGLHVILLTIVLPGCFAYAYVMAKRRYGDAGAFVALPMVIGLWTLGGLFMNVAATFSGGGFAALGGLRDEFLNVLLAFLPPYTFMMAAYDGALFGLLLATVVPLLASIPFMKRESEGTRITPFRCVLALTVELCSRTARFTHSHALTLERRKTQR